MKSVVIITLFLCLCLFQGNSIKAYAQDKDTFAPYDGIPEGYRLFEGDILIPVFLPEGVFATNLWTGGIVPFEFDANVAADNRNLMIQAMAEWEGVADVDFQQCAGNNCIEDLKLYYLHIQNSTENSSAVGMVSPRQVVNIVDWGVKFVMAHELGHALGFWHEQSRPDRDTYVTINTDRIPDDKEYNFERHDEADVYGGYDFDSVMHYKQCDFSCCNEATPCCTKPCSCAIDPSNCRTITVKPPWDTIWQNLIGQRDHFSNLDKITMSMLYPEDNWVFVDINYDGFLSFGTFFEPYKQLSNGISSVPTGGTIIIQPGDYTVPAGEYTKAMAWDAPLGGVVISCN